MQATFITTAAPEGWQLGRWSQVSDTIWEEAKESGETYTYEDAGPSETPGSSTIRLRLQTDQATCEVLLVDRSIQVFVDGTYFGEYLGSWAGGPSRSASVVGSAPGVPSRLMSRQNSGMTEKSMNKSVPGSIATEPAKKQPPQRPEKKPNCDTTPAMVERLYQAAKAGDETQVLQLLMHPVDPDGVSPSENLTPLIAGAQKGSVKVVEALLQFGADVNRDCGGHTAMIAAYQKGKKDVLRALFAATFASLDATIGGGVQALPAHATQLHTIEEDDGNADCLDHVRDLQEVTTRLAHVHHKVKHHDESLASIEGTVPDNDSDAQREQTVRETMRALLSASHRDPSASGP